MSSNTPTQIIEPDSPAGLKPALGHDGDAPQALPIGKRLHDNYQIRRILGQGGFAITYLCLDEFFEVEVAI